MSSAKSGLLQRALSHVAFRLSRLRQDFARGWMGRRRRRFAALPRERLLLPPAPVALPGVQIFSLGCERDVPEQTLSFLSFLRHVGVPEKWTIVSDGSHLEKSREFFKALHPCLQIRPWTDFITPLNRAAVEGFVALHHMGKKLALISALPADPVSIYIDSDILFFARGNELRDLLREKAQGNCFYMLDNYPAKGPPLRPEELRPNELGLNAGFLIQGRTLDWTEALTRAEGFLVDEPEMRAFIKKRVHIWEQTIVHLTYVFQGARPLGPEYLVSNADLNNIFDTSVRKGLVARHYIWELKHQMWHHAPAYWK